MLKVCGISILPIYFSFKVFKESSDKSRNSEFIRQVDVLEAMPYNTKTFNNILGVLFSYIDENGKSHEFTVYMHSTLRNFIIKDASIGKELQSFSFRTIYENGKVYATDLIEEAKNRKKNGYYYHLSEEQAEWCMSRFLKQVEDPTLYYIKEANIENLKETIYYTAISFTYYLLGGDSCIYKDLIKGMFDCIDNIDISCYMQHAEEFNRLVSITNPTYWIQCPNLKDKTVGELTSYCKEISLDGVSFHAEELENVAFLTPFHKNSCSISLDKEKPFLSALTSILANDYCVKNMLKALRTRHLFLEKSDTIKELLTVATEEDMNNIFSCLSLYGYIPNLIKLFLTCLSKGFIDEINVQTAYKYKLALEEKCRENNRNVFHDTDLLYDYLLKIVKFNKVDKDFFNKIIQINPIGMADASFLSSVIGSVKPTKFNEFKDKVISCIKKGVSIGNYSDYSSFLRKNSSNESYMAVLKECNKYAAIDIKSLKSAVSCTHLKKMENKELENWIKPIKLTYKKLVNEVFSDVVNSLLKTKNGIPTAEQRKLYYLMKGKLKYSMLPTVKLDEILVQIGRIDKQKEDMLRKLPHYSIEVLDKNDFRNIIIGDATNCCMTAGTKKQQIYTAHPCFNQLVVTDEEHHKIVVSSVLWIDMQNFLVFDNIEAIQCSVLNTYLYRVLLHYMAHKLVKQGKYAGFVQGMYNNDVELYDREAKCINQSIYAKAPDGNFYRLYYSDAYKIYTSFINPITGDPYSYKHGDYKNMG